VSAGGVSAQQLAEIEARLPGYSGMARADVAVLVEAVKALRAALEPFACAAAEYEAEHAGYVITDGLQIHGESQDGLQIDGESQIAHPILWGDLRRAAAVLGTE
jgi:hypothetical protein